MWHLHPHKHPYTFSLQHDAIRFARYNVWKCIYFVCRQENERFLSHTTHTHIHISSFCALNSFFYLDFGIQNGMFRRIYGQNNDGEKNGWKKKRENQVIDTTNTHTHTQLPHTWTLNMSSTNTSHTNRNVYHKHNLDCGFVGESRLADAIEHISFSLWMGFIFCFVSPRL